MRLCAHIVSATRLLARILILVFVGTGVLPVAGIPIEIIRTYDSRDKRQGDFGFGWTLGIKNIRLQKNRNLGRNWDIGTTGGLLPTYCMNSVRDRIVTITFPDDKVFKFKAYSTPECQFGIPPLAGQILFTNITTTSGTQGSLVPVTGNNFIAIGGVPGLVDIIDLDTLAAFNPRLFQLTTEEGDIYVIDEFDGLVSMTDRNGNTLTITSSGIIHSTGASITFDRDLEGRITGITDPAGNTLTYQYDIDGDLFEFVDRENQTNSYTYLAGHLLEKIIDPRGILLSFWKIHILHHAGEEPLHGQWMLDEMRRHGYQISPGTLYPLLRRMERLGWLECTTNPRAGKRARKDYRLTREGGKVLDLVRIQLAELRGEVAPMKRKSKARG